jgi:hypothetical protein
METPAYSPEKDPKPYEAMVADLSKREVSAKARRQLAELYIDAYRRTILERVDFPYMQAIIEGADVVGTTAGVIDGAAMLTSMTTFAEGIAAGRGSAVVEEVDVRRMQEELCDSWPECSKMRVEAGARTLTALVDKLRRSR